MFELIAKGMDPFQKVLLLEALNLEEVELTNARILAFAGEDHAGLPD